MPLAPRGGDLDPSTVHPLRVVAPHLNEVLRAEQALPMAMVATQGLVLSGLGADGALLELEGEVLLKVAPDVRRAAIVADDELHAAGVDVVDGAVWALD